MLLSIPTVLSVLALLANPIFAVNAPRAPGAGIYIESNSYEYYGCYNETVDIAGSSGARALDEGNSFVQKGNMTVPKCLEYCTSNGTDYRFAGLEYSRECWCSQSLSALSEKLSEKQCSYPCEGNATLICGGALKLSVYEFKSAASTVSQVSMLLLFGSVIIVGFC
ncbi:hypothetical protein QQZ08_005797 [Neonectria magnoliae]|uniref:WSC domain-containing protein n=1 Tax=Neonectria magnoliae TaxID=2732573 RepID=A0ABR1I2J6_9HYPO